MNQEQPGRDSNPVEQSPVEGVRAAAQELARRRWAHRQESAGQEPVETTPAVQKPKTPAQPAPAPEAEEPTSESALEEGQDEGELAEVDEEEVGHEEHSEEEQAPNVVNLDDLADDAVLVVDGQETTAREIRESRLRLDDYTRKTQAVAAQRQVLTQREQLSAYYLGQQEQGLVQALEQLRSLNWQEIAQKSPQEFAAKKAQFEGTQLRLQQVQEEQQQFLRQIKQYEDEIARQQAAVAQKELKTLIPGWNNGLYYSLIDYATEAGFKREEALKYTDPRIFVLLKKARAYDQAQQVTTKKSVKASPKRSPKAASPKSPEKRAAQDLQAVQQQAAKAGTIDAAVELLRAKRQATR
jgi:hypothetical protein